MFYYINVNVVATVSFEKQVYVYDIRQNDRIILLYYCTLIGHVSWQCNYYILSMYHTHTCAYILKNIFLALILKRALNKDQ